MKTFFVMFTNLLLAATLHAAAGQSVNLPKSVEKDIGRFFTQMKKSNFDLAVKDLFRDSPIGEKSGAIEKLSKQLKFILDVYGKIEVVEQIDVRSKGQNLLQARYLVFFQGYPIRFIFSYFQNPVEKEWILGHFSFDDQVHLLFENN